ncbi:MAG: 16S rRNA (guanine(527)-N(7))-methyltransferase RsmG [Rhodobacteraceae bacterium]|nr:16S rRNA (guanine(527)-N(7))-methyltransferase RsmG [Paracoccaceae bacterium]
MLDAYKAIVLRWNRAINLISERSAKDIDRRHIADSLQLCPLIVRPIERWCDIGSGAGFPGMVVAIYSHTMGKPLDMHLVEVDARKAVFLREASRQLGLKVTVHNKRVEDLPPLHCDVVSARALAPLATLCSMASPHLASAGICVFPKGASYREEVRSAKAEWNFSLEAIPSQTDENAVILLLKEVSRVTT